MLRTRFAPAPTGLLHLGHVVNAMHVWGLAGTCGASVVLRIEDHDRERSRPTYERTILDDLDWLGFVPHLYPTDVFRGGRCESRQSDRQAIYLSHAARLLAAGRVYGCVCTRQDLAVHRGTGGDNALAYPGTCRSRGIPPGDHVAWRVRLEDIEPGPIDELLAGPVPPERAGDPVIRDRRGNWTYQFAVTVDDLDQQIDLVVRGRDLLDSTPLQVRLARLFGRDVPPRFAHHPLMMRTATDKLSKSAGDTGVSELRAAGWTAERLLGHAAHRIGLVAVDRPIKAIDVPALFDEAFRRIRPSP